MSSEGATSPQGWSLSAPEICEAASMSLSLRHATDDEAEVRAQFINQIRARSAASSKYLSGARPIPDLMQEEMRLVRSMVENWPTENDTEAGIRATAHPVSDASAPISPSQVPPSRRIRSSSPTSDAPDLKRPKLAAPGKTLAQGHADSPSESAASLFFRIPELLSLVFAQLAYEKIDLVVLSRVSRFLRANVLPLLVESLNVPLTKAAQVRDFLESNPGLAGQVKYVRIFDDIAHHLFHRRPFLSHGLSVQRSHDAPLMPMDTWEHLGNLLTTLQNNVEMLPPLMDLSFGQFNLANVLIQLRRHPRLVERLASLRIVDDFDPEHHQGEAPDDFEYHVGFRFRMFSEDLADVVRLVCDVQDEVGSDTFRYFGIRAADSFDRPAFLPEFGPRLLTRLAKRIRHLSLVMDSVSKDDTDTYVKMADADWPELLGFEVGARALGGDWHRTLRSATVAFCSGHKNLTVTDTCIELPGNRPSAPYYWVHLTLPRLKSCSLAYLDFADNESAVEFLSRHANIQHLSMPEPLYEVEILASHMASTTSLRSFRSFLSILPRLSLHRTALQHIQVLDDVQNETGYVHVLPFVFSRGPLVPTISCLEIAFDELDAQELASRFLGSIPLWQLPNLFELAFSCQKTRAHNYRDTPQESANVLAKLLGRLSRDKRLRAVRMSCEAASVLPDDAELNEVVIALPPNLEYVTWHVPFSTTTHHYCVLRLPSPTAAHEPSLGIVTGSNQQTKQSSEAAAPQRPQARLQRLPASFRPKVNKKTGVWEDLDDDRTRNTLYDHMGDEPVLKYA